jgi:hypothetical protein
MSPKRISLELSPEQRRQIKLATGKDAGALELTVEELEERIAPVVARTPSPGGPLPIPYPNTGS